MTPPDQTARHDGLGVAVWRYDSGPMGPLYDEGGPTEILGATPGKWFPTDAEALAEIEESIAKLDPEAWMLNAGYRRGIATTLRALGLTT